MEAVYWLIILAVLLVAELMTFGLVTIWFAGGALAAFIAATAGANLGVQIVLFLGVSLVLLFLTRPFAVKYLNKNKTATNVDSLVGQTGIVMEAINNLEGKGKVMLNGQEWTARTRKDETVLAKGKKVTVKKISGVKLIVEEKTEENEQ
ncbi:NfeD family protein [Anaerobium acetethylicum]|uniref:Membrane protein implicated in regulation of membrane protease activity n=1 Tax=Anaerobium acetethylicum TaxID=1619234 RepID=A0A1D3TSB2_9FIRM|nr:NfeD family protein [Anaerobium acetethylicum]SCP96739.1 Membrane protein implicated in regulation of membrane protease activity [Anaerobium acetethylicum]